MMHCIGPPQVTRQQQINNIEVMDGVVLVHEYAATVCVVNYKGLWEPFKNLIHCSEICS